MHSAPFSKIYNDTGDLTVAVVTTRVQIKDLNTGIANFYDESSGLWEGVWGEHMHHGAKQLSVGLSNGS